MEQVGVRNTGVEGLAADTVVDVLIVKVDAQFCKETSRVKGPLLEVLLDVYKGLNDVGVLDEEEDVPDLSSLEGVFAALEEYSERAGEEDDVVSIINLADVTEIF